MKFLAIVPARGGSKGVKGKNLRKVGNKSLLKRAIASTANFMDVIVSTDSHLIKEEALKVGAIVPFMRPNELSTDNANTIDVVLHAIKEYERLVDCRYDYIFTIEPTSPFREEKHVKNAIEKIKTNKFKSIISVCNLERKPENIFLKDFFLERYIKIPNQTFEQRQNMDHLCRLNSAIYATNRDCLIKDKKLLIDPIGFTEMSQVESINIDSELDLKFANFISKTFDL
ncbi:hypothetical protein CU311_06760 [Prochlorococcus marinus str. MU1402]|uniref:acylneuraminate cytidylyltransferase family protein n=1 Tax=Prochlorococcus marinus TaxID=1219 RepID=UPI001ADB8D58|nr:acylneuraminate cytidylyltransferase family protein [Prochlorococcus marinus]MBO8232380.1 acylneuraminate cytidylyltransferase family protein [Prochlorococcus marinus XMU1402]MBW3057108.1 hypothetical protein [Prochlorococcus marinus str. MU1402]